MKEVMLEFVIYFILCVLQYNIVKRYGHPDMDFCYWCSDPSCDLCYNKNIQVLEVAQRCYQSSV